MGLRLKNTNKASSISFNIGGHLIEVVSGKDIELPENIQHVDIAAIVARHPGLELSDPNQASGKLPPVSLPGVDPRVLSKHPSLVPPSESTELRRALEAADPVTHSRHTVVTPKDFVDRPAVMLPGVGGPDAADLVAQGRITVDDVEKALQPGVGTGPLGNIVKGAQTSIPAVNMAEGVAVPPQGTTTPSQAEVDAARQGGNVNPITGAPNQNTETVEKLTEDNTKTQLEEIAKKEKVEVKDGATKQEIAEAIHKSRQKNVGPLGAPRNLPPADAVKPDGSLAAGQPSNEESKKDQQKSEEKKSEEKK